MEEKEILKCVPFSYEAPALYEIQFSRFSAMGDGSGGLPKEKKDWDDAFA